MTQPIVIVDAFTDRPFAGNPAAVCVLRAPRDAAWMQQVAAEMNLAETAFLQPRAADGYDLRWFTPVAEVDLCGHATLASAHVLWQTGALPADREARFWTRSGLLTANRSGEWIELDFPATPVAPVEPPDGLIAALGVEPLFVGHSRFDYLIEVASEAIVRGVEPDFRRLATIGGRGAIVTSRASTPGFDVVSRCFFPQLGIDEDPVTGSAHCAIGPYWQAKLGTDKLIAYQASRRGGVLRLSMDGERVRLRGQAVTVLRGELADQL